MPPLILTKNLLYLQFVPSTIRSGLMSDLMTQL